MTRSAPFYYLNKLSVCVLLHFAMMLAGCEDKRKKSEWIHDVFGLELLSEFDLPLRLVKRTRHVIIFTLSSHTIQRIRETRLLDYSDWREISPDESYGDTELVIDGAQRKGLLEAHRYHNSQHQRIIIDPKKNEIIFIKA